MSSLISVILRRHVVRHCEPTHRVLRAPIVPRSQGLKPLPKTFQPRDSKSGEKRVKSREMFHIS